MNYPRDLLFSVTSPSRYLGGEINRSSSAQAGDVSVCLAYPDIYEVGMSYAGLLILYHLLDRMVGVHVERAFAPWPDMEAGLRERGLSLLSLETGTPLSSFDVVGISVQHDLAFTNVLLLLDLGGIPLEWAERNDSDSWVIVGGPCAANPEPLSRFADAFCIGDGESLLPEVVSTIGPLRKKGASRVEIREALARIPGVYVPALVDVTFFPSGKVAGFSPEGFHVNRRVENPETAFYPTKVLVPNLSPVHDRYTLEIRRGCLRGCRFCRAGFTTRPLRERTPGTLLRLAREALLESGQDEIGLLSLSTGDYTAIRLLFAALTRGYEEERLTFSLPSLRLDGFEPDVLKRLTGGRRITLTFAPEVGSERLRGVINKRITLETMMETVRQSLGVGFDRIKLYFMVGLPTETEEDVEGIVELIRGFENELRGIGRGRARLNVSIGGFVPGPHTPFQWASQPSPEVLRDRMTHVRNALRKGGTRVTYHEPRVARIEALFSRGDRRLGEVLLRAYRAGCRFDAWSDQFRYEIWLRVCEDCGIDPDFFTSRERSEEEVFPWDFVNTGVSREFLLREWKKAMAGEYTEDCVTGRCSACGACDPIPAHRLAPDEEEPVPQDFQPSPGERIEERYLLRYRKTGPLAWLGHLDFQRLMQKVFRRANIRMAYSGGFHPHPRLLFAAPLPVGEEGWNEAAEVVIEREVGKELDILTALNAVCPEGLAFRSGTRLPEETPKLTRRLTGYSYGVRLSPQRLSVSQAVEEMVLISLEIMEATSVRVKRRGKEGETTEIDIRPYIQTLQVTERADASGTDEIVLQFDLKLIEGRTARAEEVVRALCLNLEYEVRVMVRADLHLK